MNNSYTKEEFANALVYSAILLLSGKKSSKMLEDLFNESSNIKAITESYIKMQKSYPEDTIFSVVEAINETISLHLSNL